MKKSPSLLIFLYLSLILAFKIQASIFEGEEVANYSQRYVMDDQKASSMKNENILSVTAFIDDIKNRDLKNIRALNLSNSYISNESIKLINDFIVNELLLLEELNLSSSHNLDKEGLKLFNDLIDKDEFKYLIVLSTPVSIIDDIRVLLQDKSFNKGSQAEKKLIWCEESWLKTASMQPHLTTETIKTHQKYYQKIKPRAFDYSCYQVSDNELTSSTTSNLSVTDFLEDIKQRDNKLQEEIEDGINYIKISTGFILDGGFKEILDCFTSESFLPSLAVLDLSFNRISSSILKAHLGSLKLLLNRPKFKFIDMRNNPAASSEVQEFFSELLFDEIKKIIWISNESTLRSLNWVTALQKRDQAQILEEVRTIFSQHTNYLSYRIPYNDQFTLMSQDQETVEDKLIIPKWEDFFNIIIGNTDDYRLNIIIKFAKEGKNLEEQTKNKLLIGKFFYEKGEFEAAAKVFYTLAQEEGVPLLNIIQGEAYYLLSQMYREGQYFPINYGESERLYDKAYKLGFKQGW
jgi:hypothetical protein